MGTLMIFLEFRFLNDGFPVTLPITGRSLMVCLYLETKQLHFIGLVVFRPLVNKCQRTIVPESIVEEILSRIETISYTVVVELKNRLGWAESSGQKLLSKRIILPHL